MTDTLWTQNVVLPRFSTLASDITVDTVVVGGGIAGITTALLLKEAGQKVALVEARRLTLGETGRTTAHVTAVQDTPFRTLVSRFGEAGARAVAQAGMRALSFIESRCTVDAAFERLPLYIYAETVEHRDNLKEELEAAHAVSLECGWVDRAPLPYDTQGALRFEGQARFHPLRYLLPLLSRIQGEGCLVFEATRALKILDGEPCEVITETGTLRARSVVVTTDSVVANRFLLHAKVGPYRTYVLTAELDRELPGLFYDTADPYHYVRTQPVDGRHVLIVGGEDHRVGEQEDTEEPYRKLQTFLTDRFGSLPVRERWSGQVLEPIDGLPYIGKNPDSEHLYVATGFSGTGMVNGTLAGIFLSNEVLGRPDRDAEWFAARRIKPLASATHFLKENLDTPKHLVQDRLPAKYDSVKDLATGQGRVVDQGNGKVAVFRDANGGLHGLSPVCPHLGCHVHWNTTEKSWDCPCHGSRFDNEGAVLHGPATKGLEPREVRED